MRKLLQWREKNDLYSLHALGLIYPYMNLRIWGEGSTYSVSEIVKVFNNLVTANCTKLLFPTVNWIATPNNNVGSTCFVLKTS